MFHEAVVYLVIFQKVHMHSRRIRHQTRCIEDLIQYTSTIIHMCMEAVSSKETLCTSTSRSLNLDIIPHILYMEYVHCQNYQSRKSSADPENPKKTVHIPSALGAEQPCPNSVERVDSTRL